MNNEINDQQHNNETTPIQNNIKDPLDFLNNPSPTNSQDILSTMKNRVINIKVKDKSKVIIIILIICALFLFLLSLLITNNPNSKTDSSLKEKNVKALKVSQGKYEYVHEVKENELIPSNLKIGSYVGVSVSYTIGTQTDTKVFVENTKVLDMKDSDGNTIDGSKDKEKIKTIKLELSQEPYELLTKIPADNHYNIKISLTKSNNINVGEDLESTIVSEEIKELLNSIVNPIEPLSPREGLYEYNLSTQLITSDITNFKIGDYINIVAYSINDGNSSTMVMNTRILNFKDVNGVDSQNNSLVSTIVIESDYQISYMLDKAKYATYFLKFGLEKVEETPYIFPTLGNDENLLLSIEMAGQ